MVEVGTPDTLSPRKKHFEGRVHPIPLVNDQLHHHQNLLLPKRRRIKRILHLVDVVEDEDTGKPALAEVEELIGVVEDMEQVEAEVDEAQDLMA